MFEKTEVHSWEVKPFLMLKFLQIFKFIELI